MIDQVAARDIDQVQTGFGMLEGGAVDGVARFRRRWCGQHQVVGARDQFLQSGHPLHALHFERRVGAAQRHHLDTQRQRALRQRLADGAEAVQAQGGALHQSQRQAAPVAGLLQPDLRHALGGSEDRRQHVFGNGDGRGTARRRHHRSVEQPVRVIVDAHRRQLHPAHFLPAAGRGRVQQRLALGRRQRKHHVGARRQRGQRARWHIDHGQPGALRQQGIDLGVELAGYDDIAHVLLLL